MSVLQDPLLTTSIAGYQRSDAVSNVRDLLPQRINIGMLFLFSRLITFLCCQSILKDSELSPAEKIGVELVVCPGFSAFFSFLCMRLFDCKLTLPQFQPDDLGSSQRQPRKRGRALSHSALSSLASSRSSILPTIAEGSERGSEATERGSEATERGSEAAFA